MIQSTIFLVLWLQGVLHNPFAIDWQKKQVARHDISGAIVWSVTFDEKIGTVRPPDFLWDEQRFYLSYKDGVTALDAGNGKTLWHTEGPRYGLLLSDGLLLGTGRIKNKDNTYSTWLFACDVKKGMVKFKLRLPEDLSDPNTVTQIVKLFLVQDFFSEGHALLIDRNGEIRHQFDRLVISGKQSGEDIIFLTCKNVVRVTTKDEVVWTVPFDDYGRLADGELIDLPDGDIIASQFGRISDSGVSLIRFDPTNGKAKWQVHCKELGVAHFKYSHSAKVAVEGEKLRVTSTGSGGSFVEILELKTGRQLERTLNDR